MRQWWRTTSLRNFSRSLVNVLDGRPTRMRGQSLVEMTFTFPLLIILVLGIAEVGLLANNMLTLMDVAREASRRAVSLDPRTWPPGSARHGERLDCDLIQDGGTNKYALTFGGKPSVDRDQAGEWRAQNLAGLTTDAYKQGSETREFGFFDAIACYALSILDPLVFDDTATGKDDVIVSVVSYVTMDFSSSGPYRQYEAINGVQVLSNTLPIDTSQDPDAPYEYYATVTGRWPLENRFCNTNSNAAFNDYRDPFDYLRTDFNLVKVLTWEPSFDGVTAFKLVQPLPDVTNGDRGQVNEFGEKNPDGVSYQPYKFVLSAAESQGVRGYTFSGKARNDTNAGGCYGSRWTVGSIEQLLNQQISGEAATRNLLKDKVSNGALVIVELHWQYHPFFAGRIFADFRAIFDKTITPADDPMLYVYSMFQVGAAEPTATP